MKNRLLAAGAAAVVVFTAPFHARADYQSTILSDNPAGYWRLGEMSVALSDYSQITNLGTLGASANGSTLTGYVGRAESGALAGGTDTAMRFWGNVGELSRVTISNQSAFNFTGDGTAMPFTLEVWAKPMIIPTTTQSQRLMANGAPGQGYALTLYGGSTIRFTALGVVDVNSDATPFPIMSNQWYHIVAARGVSNVTFYLNGVQLGAVKACVNVKAATNYLTLARMPLDAEQFTGVLDEPAVYNKVLSADRVAAHYAAAMTNGAGYAAVVLADSPIGYWRLNEPKPPIPAIANSGSAGSSADGGLYGSPYGAANTVTGGITGALAGDANTALGFSGTGTRVNVPNRAALNTPSFTVECWARMDTWANAYQSPISDRYVLGTTYQGFILYATPLNGSPSWEFWNCTGTGFQTLASGVSNVVLQKWTHVVGTYDATTRTKVLYVDGQIVGGAVNVAHSPNTLAPLRIGAGANEVMNYANYFWRGGLDEVAVYPTALSPQRVQAHYEAALAVSPGLSNAPSIAADPVSKTNWAPNATTLGCAVKGSLPMGFQWYRVSADGLTTNLVPNATNMDLTLATTDPTNSGYYFLSAQNALGSTNSALAWLECTPLTAPVFTLFAPTTVPVYVGGTAQLTASAIGTTPITYQWQSNSVDIAGATNATLTLPNVQVAQNGITFQVKASNLAGTTTSDPAQLSVLTPPTSTYAAVVSRLNPLAYWRLGETSQYAYDYCGGHHALYSNASQGMSPGALQDNDDGAVMVSSGAYVRTVETAPFNFAGNQDFTLSIFVNANSFLTGTNVARLFSTTTMVGTSYAGYALGIVANNIVRFTAQGNAEVSISVPKFEVNQWYHIAAVRSNNLVYLYVNGALKGGGGVQYVYPTTYALQMGGNPASTVTEGLDGLLDEAAVFNRALSAGEISALYAARYGSLNPPAITSQPAPESLFAGGTARFSVAATGSEPLRYQWKANGAVIAGATNTSLTISPVSAANNGVSYSVVVSNMAGTVTSDSALLSVSQPNKYASVVLADSPVGFWRLGESYGPVAYDSWGGFNGVDNGAVLYGTSGALLNDANTAASFDGSNSRVEVPYAPALNPAVYTFEAWAKINGGQGTYRALVSTRDEQSAVYQKGVIIYATAGNIWSFWTSPAAGWETLDGPAVVIGEWTHLAAVYDGKTKFFYVNGVLVGTQTTTSVPNNLRPFRIGEGRNEYDPGDYHFNGDIDEVAIYNSALSADRIAYHYNYGKYSTTTAPFFLTKPAASTLVAGQSVTLASLAGGSPPLSYQWFKDGVAISGATNANFAVANATYAASGNYAVTASNGLASTNSEPVKLAVLPAPQFANATNDLVLHLPFDGAYADTSGRGNNATNVGSTTFVAGKIGASALHYFTDVDQGLYNYATLGTPADLQFSSNVSFSVSYWVRFTGKPGDLPFLCSANVSYSNPGFTFAPSYTNGGWSWSLGQANSSAYVGVYGAANSINNGNWHHLLHTFSRDASRAITYLDGTQVDSRAITAGADIDTGNVVNIGQDPTGFYAETGDADIDDLGVWRRVITAYEALGIYNAGLAGRSLDAYGPVQIGIERTSDGVTLVWQAGTLLEANSISGPYTPVAGAVAPLYKVKPTEHLKFYRVQL